MSNSDLGRISLPVSLELPRECAPICQACGSLPMVVRLGKPPLQLYVTGQRLVGVEIDLGEILGGRDPRLRSLACE